MEGGPWTEFQGVKIHTILSNYFLQPLKKTWIESSLIKFWKLIFQNMSSDKLFKYAKLNSILEIKVDLKQILVDL